MQTVESLLLLGREAAMVKENPRFPQNYVTSVLKTKLARK